MLASQPDRSGPPARLLGRMICQTAGATLRIRWILLRLASDSHELSHCGGSLRGEIRVTNPDFQTEPQDESTRRVERGRQRREKTRARSLRLQLVPHAMSGACLSPRPGDGQASSLALSPGVDSSDCDIMSCMPRDVCAISYRECRAMCVWEQVILLWP